MNPLLSLIAADKPLLLDDLLSTSGPDAVLLDFAIRDASPAAGPMRVLELGSWIGQSTLRMAAAMANHAPAGGAIFAVDRWEVGTRATDMNAMQRDDYLPMFRLSQNDLAYDIFRHNIRFVPDTVAVHTLRGPAAAIAPALAHGFDLILVDASPYADEVAPCLKAAKNLVRDGGLILVTKAQLPVEIAGTDLCQRHDHTAELYHAALRMNFYPGVSQALQQAFPGVMPITEIVAVRRRGEAFLPYAPAPGLYQAPEYLQDVSPHFPRFDGVPVALRRWEYLRASHRPLWLYGAGEAGQRGCLFARAAGIDPAGFIDTYRRGSQMDLPIIGLEDLLTKQSTLDVVITTLHWPTILPSLASLADSRIFVSTLPTADAIVDAPSSAR